MFIDRPVTPGAGEKTIVVVSDLESLCRAVKINLACLDGVRVLGLIVGKSGVLCLEGDDGENWNRTRKEAQGSDLLVVAHGSPLDGPLVMMARAGLLDCVGQVPLLIIQDDRRRSVPELQITHMDFPFEAEDLQRTALKLLGMPVVPPETNGGGLAVGLDR